MLFQNALGFLLQNETVSFQIATVMTKYVDFISKYDSYYKVRHLLQNASVQWLIQNGCNKRKERIHEGSLILIANRYESPFYDTLST